jgi:hypothetical protein
MNAGTPPLHRLFSPPNQRGDTKLDKDDIAANDEWISTHSGDTDISIYGDASSDSDSDDRSSKKTIAQGVASKINQATTSASIYVNDDAGRNTQSNVDNDAGNDADNKVGKSENNIPLQNFLHTLNKTLQPTTAPVEQDDLAAGAYDCREFARTIRGNWKIIAPSLTAASGVAAVAMLTIAARGSIGDTQLSLGARFGTWIGGYFVTQATIIFGASCIPNLQCR